ncbi:MAG: sporulation protein [Pseudonocardiaceae bacterium]
MTKQVEQVTGDRNTIDIAARLGEVIGASKVFGEPIERGNVTIVPVFRVSGAGGSGGGSNSDRDSGGQGFGGGLRCGSRPVGAYVLEPGSVSWKPAVDVNQAIIAGAAVAITALATIRTIIRRVTG